MAMQRALRKILDKNRAPDISRAPTTIICARVSMSSPDAYGSVALFIAYPYLH